MCLTSYRNTVNGPLKLFGRCTTVLDFSTSSQIPFPLSIVTSHQWLAFSVRWVCRHCTHFVGCVRLPYRFPPRWWWSCRLNWKNIPTMRTSLETEITNMELIVEGDQQLESAEEGGIEWEDTLSIGGLITGTYFMFDTVDFLRQDWEGPWISKHLSTWVTRSSAFFCIWVIALNTLTLQCLDAPQCACIREKNDTWSCAEDTLHASKFYPKPRVSNTSAIHLVVS